MWRRIHKRPSRERCLCLFHREYLRHFEKDNIWVCTQCHDLLSKDDVNSSSTQNDVTPSNDIQVDKENLLRAPKKNSENRGTSNGSFTNELTLFKLHLLEEEQELARKRQQEKEQRCREINALKDQEIRRLQAMRDEEILKKEREAVESNARMEKLELEFQQQQSLQDSEFMRKKSLVINDPETDLLKLNIAEEPSNSCGARVVRVEQNNGKRLASSTVDQLAGEFPQDQSTIQATNNLRSSFSSGKHPQEKRIESPEHKHALTSLHLASRKGMNNDLPKFSGSPRDWPYFMKRFESTTESCFFNNVENLSRLNNALQGPAREAVSGLLLHEHNVPTIIHRLQTFFGRPKYIINDLVSELRCEKPLRLDNLRSLLKFSNKVSNLVATLQTAEASNHLWSPYLIDDMIEKLPLQLQRDWAHHKQSYKEVNLEIFAMWLNSEAEMLTNISPKSLLYDDSDNRKTKAFVNFHDDQSRTCYSNSCSENCESLSQCPEFKNMTFGKRMELVSKKYLCRSCLKRCKKRCNKTMCGIDGCTYYHHELLHKGDKNSNIGSSDVKSVASVNTYIHKVGKIWFKILPVILHKGEKSIKTLALLDGAASISLIEESLSNALSLDGTPEELCMKWTNGAHQSFKSSKRVFLEVSSLDNPLKRTQLNDVRTVRTLELPKQSLNKDDIHSISICKAFRSHNTLKGNHKS